MSTTTFQQNSQVTIEGVPSYAWSTTANWTPGAPVDGDSVIYDVPTSTNPGGIDDIASLQLASLALDQGYLAVIGALTVDSLTFGGLFGEIYADDNLGTTNATIDIDALSGSGGHIGATGAGALANVLAPTDPGETYFADDGGEVALTATPNSASIFDFDNASSPGTFAFRSLGSTVASALEGVGAGDDSVALPVASVTSVTYGASSIAIGTNLGTKTFSNVSYDGTTPTAYAVSVDPVTGEPLVTFEGKIVNLGGGGYKLYFPAGPGNFAEIFHTDGDADTVTISDGTLQLFASQSAVIGGGNTIDFENGPGNLANLSGTGGVWDAVNCSDGSGTIELTSAQTSVTVGGETIDILGGTGNAVSLYSTANDWDAVYGNGSSVYLYNAQSAVDGGADVVDFSSAPGNRVSLYNTAGSWDTVNSADATMYLDSAQASIFGGGNTIYFLGGSGNAASLYGASAVGDLVDGSNGAVYLNNGQAAVIGGGDTIDFGGGSNAATLFNSANNWDEVNGSGGIVDFSSAQAAVVGAGNTIDFTGGTGNAVSLYNTAGDWDSVTGSNGSVYLNSAQAGVAGSGDTIDMTGTSSVTQSGSSDAFVFQAAIGVEKINGFDSTDSMQFSASDFLNFSAMMSHTTQSGSATVIKLDANDKVTLANTLDTSLVASQFHFV